MKKYCIQLYLLLLLYYFYIIIIFALGVLTLLESRTSPPFIFDSPENW